MRLRPFGDSGPLVMSFDGFEDYLQQHGRDWERYAFVKARPVTCIDQYHPLYTNVIRPFVYRRYLDFSVFEALRDMKQMIAREVERRELHNHVKLGPGGIREVEFIVQAFQLLRGGNDRQLQSTELQTVLPLLIHHNCLTQFKWMNYCRLINSCASLKTGYNSGVITIHITCPRMKCHACGWPCRWVTARGSCCWRSWTRTVNTSVTALLPWCLAQNMTRSSLTLR